MNAILFHFPLLTHWSAGDHCLPVFRTPLPFSCYCVLLSCTLPFNPSVLVHELTVCPISSICMHMLRPSPWWWCWIMMMAITWNLHQRNAGRMRLQRICRNLKSLVDLDPKFVMKTLRRIWQRCKSVHRLAFYRGRNSLISSFLLTSCCSHLSAHGVNLSGSLPSVLLHHQKWHENRINGNGISLIRQPSLFLSRCPPSPPTSAPDEANREKGQQEKAAANQLLRVMR